MSCLITNCEICAATKRREARGRMTKAQLRADADAADDAYMDAREVASMEHHWSRQLLAHLHQHGCDHDLADIP